MFKYSQSETESGSSNNPENLFVHRFHDNSDMALPSDVGLSSPTTFWKSPYSGDGTINGVSKGVCMKPVISIMSPKNRQTTSVDDTSKLTVKSILKHRANIENNTDTTKIESKTRQSPEPQPNLITTGTGKGRPYGSPVRAKTAIKRVQFNGLSNKNSLDFKRDSLNVFHSATSPHFMGRRLFLDRQTSTRILGTPNRAGNRWQIHNQNNTNTAVDTINSGEANIKYQINAFIRKLRLAEAEKLSKPEADSKTNISDQNAQRKTAAKLRKSRSFSGTTIRQDWAEFDIEKIYSNADCSNDDDLSQINDAENAPSIVYDAKSRSVSSGSISIESFSSADEDQIVERTPGGAKVFRPKPNASLYTKYRHITTNDKVNKYGYRSKSSVEPRGKQTVNFCDRRKTSQILGWLEEVRSAQSNTELPADQPTDKL